MLNELYLFSQEDTSSEKLIKKEEAIQSWFFSLNICPVLPRVAMVKWKIGDGIFTRTMGYLWEIVQKYTR